MVDLSEIPTKQLLRELAQRASCEEAPEKHIILIGRDFFQRQQLPHSRWSWTYKLPL